MNLDELADNAPSVVIGALLWYRMGRMEGHQEMIMRELKIEPLPKRKGGLAGFLCILAAPFLGMGPGCAMNRPYMLTESTSTNGAAVRNISKATTLAIWPATSEVMKQRISNGKTQSIGQEGIVESAQLSTNDSRVISDIRAILGR